MINLLCANSQERHSNHVGPKQKASNRYPLLSVKGNVELPDSKVYHLLTSGSVNVCNISTLYKNNMK